MEYKILCLLILAFAVVYVQAGKLKKNYYYM